MTSPEATRPATVVSGHLALTEEVRDRIREELLGLLDRATRAAEARDVDGEDRTEHARRVAAVEAVRAALVKLDAGYYGVCEICEGPIPFERLQALPAVRCCVGCQLDPQRALR